MITQEKAKTLKVGDFVHCCLIPRTKCEVWKVGKPYQDYNEGWLVHLQKVEDKNTWAGISEVRMAEWHLPGECFPPSRELRIEVRRVYDRKSVGSFYVPLDASDEFLQRNIPALIRGAIIIAEEGLTEGDK